MTTPQLALIAGLLLLVGCQPPMNTLAISGAASRTLAAPRETLPARIEGVLREIQTRRLNTQEHGAWQIVHGCVGFREQFMIDHEQQAQPALEFLLQGGEVIGWEWELGNKLREYAGLRGIRAPIRPGSSTAQGHADQWLGYLACCQLPLETPLVVNGETHTLAAALAQLEYDVPHNVEREYSWTLMALATYRPHTHTWTAADGQTWNIARLVEIELNQELAESPCGGAHRLVGLALADRRRRQEQGAAQGIWLQLEERLAELIARVQAYQQPDGSLSSASFERPFHSADIGQRIAAGGHVLEFLTIALADDQLAAPWVTRAVSALCQQLELTQQHALHCGALYHAASALRLYHERLLKAPNDEAPMSKE